MHTGRSLIILVLRKQSVKAANPRVILRISLAMSDTPFNVILQQAATLKTAQMASFRTKFDSFELWFQHSLYSKEDIVSLRKCGNFEQKYSFAQNCKLIGNKHHESHDFISAINEYERALSLFHWVESTDNDWKKKAIEDSSLLEHTYEPENDEQAEKILDLNISCVSNLSQCYLKLEEYKLCIAACTFILTTLDPSNVKALFRRAQALIAPLSSGTIEHKDALQDLRKATELQPNDMKIKSEYLRLKTLMSAQIEKDKKTYNNLFARDTMIDDTDIKTDNDNIKPPPMTLLDAQNTLRDLESARRTFEQEKNYQGVRTVREKMIAIQAILTEYQQSQAQTTSKNKLSSLNSECADFYHPTQEMIDEAKVHGVDLTDRKVQQLMHEMNQARLNDTKDATSSKINKQSQSTKDVKSSSTDSTSDSTDRHLQSALLAIRTEEAHEIAKKALNGLTKKDLLKMLTTRQMWTFYCNNDNSDTDAVTKMSTANNTSIKQQHEMKMMHKTVLKSIQNALTTYDIEKLTAELTTAMVTDILSVYVECDKNHTKHTKHNTNNTNNTKTSNEQENIIDSCVDEDSIDIDVNGEIIDMLQVKYFSDSSSSDFGSTITEKTTKQVNADNRQRRRLFGTKYTTVLVALIGFIVYIVGKVVYKVYLQYNVDL